MPTNNEIALVNALKEVIGLIDDQVLVRNTDKDEDIMAFVRQATRITSVLKNAQQTISNTEVLG